MIKKYSVLMFIICCFACNTFAQEEMVVRGQLTEIEDDVYYIEEDDGTTIQLRFDFQSKFYLDRKEMDVIVLRDYILPMPVTVYYYYLDGGYYVDTFFASSNLGELDFNLD